MQFFDAHRNANLNAAGIYVYVKGEKDLETRVARRGAQGAPDPTALRIAFVLLCQPKMMQAAYRDITERAGASLGAVSSVFADLKKCGLLLDRDGARERKLLEPRHLFDEWITNYPILLKPKLHPRRYSAMDRGW